MPPLELTTLWGRTDRKPTSRSLTMMSETEKSQQGDVKEIDPNDESTIGSTGRASRRR